MKSNKLNKIVAWSLIASLTFEACPVWALTKDETLYTKLNKDGSILETTASIHLHNDGELELHDKTNLENITNSNGNEKYVRKDKEIIWQTDGNDIYYQGTTKENLPITLNVKYYLNNEEKDVKDIIGQKGKIKIVLKYKNNLKHNVLINNKNTTLYTPFVIATTSIIPNTNNKNLTITNGKVIDNGQNSIVVGLASPGLYESLNINSLKGMDEITISYDTECFELSTIYSVATSKVLDNDDFKVFDDLKGLYSSIDTLSNSSKELIKGSNALLEGTSKIKDGSNELASGINTALNGSQTITNSVKDSIDNLKNDSTPALDEQTLSFIIETAKASATLSEEQCKAIKDQAIATVKKNETYQNLEQEFAKYSTAASTATSAYQELMTNYQNALNAGLTEQAEYLKAQADIVSTQIETAYNAATTYKTMMTLMEETAATTAISTAKETSLTVASEVSKNVAIQVADSAKSKFTEETISSLNTLSNGLNSLNNGLTALNQGAKTLYDGTATLTEGIATLNNGMQKFDKEGIDKLTSLVNNDMKNFDAKLQKLIKLAEEYKTFDEINDSDEGSSKIIMMIDSIKKENDNKTNDMKIAEENKSLWQKIKGLFTKEKE